MEVVVAGGHGKVAMLLHPLLRDRGDSVRALIRNPAHAADVQEAGAEPVMCDLEDEAADVAGAVGTTGAIVFAAGAGPGSGTERKRTMDLGGAVKLIDAAKANGVDRYVIVSSMGADSPPPEGDGDVFGEYLRAKADADKALAASGLAFTIVRPGGLTDEPGTGLVAAGPPTLRGKIPRADVAATLAAVLHTDATIGETFNLISGELPIDEALAAL
jgi:nucleoside-diphosphate-sugar epimerase